MLPARLRPGSLAPGDGRRISPAHARTNPGHASAWGASGCDRVRQSVFFRPVTTHRRVWRRGVRRDRPGGAAAAAPDGPRRARSRRWRCPGDDRCVFDAACRRHRRHHAAGCGSTMKEYGHCCATTAVSDRARVRSKCHDIPSARGRRPPRRAHRCGAVRTTTPVTSSTRSAVLQRAPPWRRSPLRWWSFPTRQSARVCGDLQPCRARRRRSGTAGGSHSQDRRGGDRASNPLSAQIRAALDRAAGPLRCITGRTPYPSSRSSSPGTRGGFMVRGPSLFTPCSCFTLPSANSASRVSGAW